MTTTQKSLDGKLARRFTALGSEPQRRSPHAEIEHVEARHGEACWGSSRVVVVLGSSV
jgi:hypothetical protein